VYIDLYTKWRCYLCWSSACPLVQEHEKLIRVCRVWLWTSIYIVYFSYWSSRLVEPVSSAIWGRIVVVTDCTTPEPFCFLGVIWSMGCFIKIHTQYGHLNMPFSENFDAFLQTLLPRSCAICSLFAHSSWASNTSYWTCFVFNNPFYEVRRERDGSLKKKLLPLNYHKIKNPSCS
jgi:hypothetical protein